VFFSQKTSSPNSYRKHYRYNDFSVKLNLVSVQRSKLASTTSCDCVIMNCVNEYTSHIVLSYFRMDKFHDSLHFFLSVESFMTVYIHITIVRVATATCRSNILLPSSGSKCVNLGLAHDPFLSPFFAACNPSRSTPFLRSKQHVPSTRYYLSTRVYGFISHKHTLVLLGAFAKLRQTTMSFVMSVRPHGTTRLPLHGFS